MSRSEASAKRCQCGICRVSQALQAKRMNREAISDGVDWILDAWSKSSCEVGYLLHEIKDSIDAGAELPPAVLKAFDVVARGTALARDYDPTPKWKVIAAPRFVEDYSEMTGRSPKEARKALKDIGIAPHLSTIESTVEREKN